LTAADIESFDGAVSRAMNTPRGARPLYRLRALLEAADAVRGTLNAFSTLGLTFYLRRHP